MMKFESLIQRVVLKPLFFPEYVDLLADILFL